MNGAVDVRRADFRFLLPDPDVKTVALAGAPDPALEAALERLAVSLHPARGGGAPGAGCDLVVVAGARPRAVAGAVANARHGGWLYAETSGLRAGACARRLRAAGCTEVALHWLWPRAAACREIVPLARRGAVLAALARRDPGARLRLRARAAALAARTPALRLALRDVAVIGRAP
jgi:hypothetical protein